MSDFSAYTGWAIPDGVVTQVADAAGKVLWSAVRTSGNVILEVEKITSDTYAGETTYTGEQFILLDIYPKTNGTVNVTYGGLTKTITDTSEAAEPNAQQVFFGKFYGVSDSVGTPASGIVTITGDLYAVGCGTYKSKDILGKESNSYASCITAVGDLSGVVEIPVNAFRRCQKIKSAVIPDGVISFGDVYNIEASSFRDCTNLKRVTLPNSLTDMGAHTFNGCTQLESINIPNSVTKLGSSVFSDCKSLKSVTIPNSVTTINIGAFRGCTGLTGITIPSSVTDINGNPWVGCPNVITVASDNAKFKMDGNCLVKLTTNLIISGFDDSIIPSYIKTIGQEAFACCTGLTSVTIPSSVTSIDASAFGSCTGLTSVDISNSLTSIGNSAFTNCTSLTSVTIPDSVTSIGSYAFSSCTGLTSVTFDNTSGWYVSTSSGAASGTAVDVTDPANNVTLITDTYDSYYWYRS